MGRDRRTMQRNMLNFVNNRILSNLIKNPQSPLQSSLLLNLFRIFPLLYFNTLGTLPLLWDQLFPLHGIHHENVSIFFIKQTNRLLHNPSIIQVRITEAINTAMSVYVSSVNKSIYCCCFAFTRNYTSHQHIIEINISLTFT